MCDTREYGVTKIPGGGLWTLKDKLGKGQLSWAERRGSQGRSELGKSSFKTKIRPDRERPHRSAFVQNICCFGVVSFGIRFKESHEQSLDMEGKEISWFC